MIVKMLLRMLKFDLNLGEKKVENLLRQSLNKDNGDEKPKKITDKSNLDYWF